MHDFRDCAALQCPSIAINDAALTATISSHKYGGVARFSCQPNYTIVGKESIQCATNYKWTDTTPSCKGSNLLVPPNSTRN